MRGRTKAVGVVGCVLLASLAIVFGLFHGFSDHRRFEIKEGQPSLKNEIYLTVSLVQIGKTPNERDIAAQLLCELTRGDASKQVDDASLDSIIALLDSDDDSVRYWVALCLGNFGPRAKAATPKLLKILDQTGCIKAAHTSADAARVTLQRIGAEVPGSKCP